MGLDSAGLRVNRLFPPISHAHTPCVVILTLASFRNAQILREDGSNLKALYRRGLAFEKTNDLQRAAKDLAAAAAVSPSDAAVTQAHQRIKVRCLREKGRGVEREKRRERNGGRETGKGERKADDRGGEWVMGCGACVLHARESKCCYLHV